MTETDAFGAVAVDGTPGTSCVDTTQAACVAASRSGSTFITVDTEGAPAAAAESDRRRQSVGPLTEMDGVPVAVKDVIATGSLRTTMASRHFARHVPTDDASVVAELRRAGAVILGKTNSHEFSYGILGDVGAFGSVRNPHDPDRLAGGSSSGSAAAVAMGVVSVAVGTDTAGSVRVPAALCGVAGFKPTLGRIDTTGVFPLSPTFDTLGYLGSCVRDIQAVLSSTGVLSADELGDAGDLKAVGFGGCRAEVAEDVVAAPYDMAIRRLGAPEVVTAAPHAGEPDWMHLYGTIRSREAYDIHRDLLQRDPGLYQTETRDRVLSGRSVSDGAVATAVEYIDGLRVHFLEAFADVDVLLCPSVPVLAPKALDAGRVAERQLMSCSVPWNVLGWPALSIPHWIPGCPLPQSLQIVGKPGADGAVLRAGRLIERLLTW